MHLGAVVMETYVAASWLGLDSNGADGVVEHGLCV